MYLFWLLQVLVVARGTFIVAWGNPQLWHACGIQFPDQGSNWGPLHWECGVLPTGPPGKSPSSDLLMFNYIFFFSKISYISRLLPHLFGLAPQSHPDSPSPGLQSSVRSPNKIQLLTFTLCVFFSVSTHQVPVVIPPNIMMIKNVSRYYQLCLGVRLPPTLILHQEQLICK